MTLMNTAINENKQSEDKFKLLKIPKVICLKTCFPINENDQVLVPLTGVSQLQAFVSN